MRRLRPLIGSTPAKAACYSISPFSQHSSGRFCQIHGHHHSGGDGILNDNRLAGGGRADFVSTFKAVMIDQLCRPLIHAS